MEKLKGGHFDQSTGLVFCHYNKRLKTGEYWITPDKYKERVEKQKKRHAYKWANDPSYKQSILTRSKSDKSKNRQKERAKTISFKEKRRQYIKAWNQEKYSNDDLFVLKKRLRARLKWAFKQKNEPKSRKSENYIGTSWKLCREFIEAQFTNGMNWDNKNLWHVDHFFPISIAKNRDQLKKLLHFTNLRPMWAVENIRKSCSFPKIEEIIERDELVTKWIKGKYQIS
jgi:hypothetical protein